MTDIYGWPQNAPASPASAAELKIISSILPAIDLAGLKLTHLATGQEHLVFTSSLPRYRDKVIKITRPGGYGIILEAKVGDIRIDWRRATIREYLQRLHRQKHVLSDTVEILGTTLQQNEQGATVIAIVTAQKFRAGTPPSNEEIRDYMLGLGFDQVPGAKITLTYLKNFSFYSAVHNLLISDCRSANFVKADGGLAVIDVIVQRPKGHLRQLLRHSLGVRLDGAQLRNQLDYVIATAPPGRQRNVQAAQLVEDLGGPTATLTELRIAAVRYVRRDAGHNFTAAVEAHAEAAFASMD